MANVVVPDRLTSHVAAGHPWLYADAIPAVQGAGTGDFRSYGLGWFLSLERGQKVVEHDGGMPGFLSKVSLMLVDEAAIED